MNHIKILLITCCLCLTVNADLVEFSLHSHDNQEVTGNHGGRPYHVFNEGDEAVYITASDWQGGHDPTEPVIFPKSDGYVNWEMIEDPNGDLDRPRVQTYEDGELVYVYRNVLSGDYVFYPQYQEPNETTVLLCYNEYKSVDSSLNFGNDGPVEDGDRQNALITEFMLERPVASGLNLETFVSARLEITIDDVVDMTLTGNNMSSIPSIMYVNSYQGQGILDRYEEVQAAFDLIDHENASASRLLTLDGTEEGWPVTDFSLSYYSYEDPGLREPFVMTIDVTDSVLKMIEDETEYAGFVLSGSPDGDFTLSSLDLVTRDGINYLPKLVITADIPSMTADFDDNNIIDLVDFATLAVCWMSESGDDSFNELCDINIEPDGIIDMKDFDIFASQWLDSISQ